MGDLPLWLVAAGWPAAFALAAWVLLERATLVLFAVACDLAGRDSTDPSLRPAATRLLTRFVDTVLDSRPLLAALIWWLVRRAEGKMWEASRG